MEYFFSLTFLSQVIIIYILAINLVTFFFFGVDKLQAQLDHRRTPERFLWVLTLLGGTMGALGGMHFFRHKTKKISFQIVLTLILILQMCIGYALFFL